MTSRPFTPAQARELAAAADELARQIAAADAALRADGDEHRRQAGFRLVDVAGECRRVAGELHATAADLARIAAVPTARPAGCRGACAPSTATPSPARAGRPGAAPPGAADAGATTG